MYSLGAAMISETSLMDCENLPDEMSERFDQPWYFVGDIPLKECRPWIEVMCGKCNYHPIREYVDDPEPCSMKWYVVPLKGWLFVTDDMIEVVVYFGVCENCNRVFWARQGPPFKRARCLYPAYTS